MDNIRRNQESNPGPLSIYARIFFSRLSSSGLKNNQALYNSAEIKSI